MEKPKEEKDTFFDKRKDTEPPTYICRDCLWQKLDEYWEDRYIDTLLDQIKDKFNKNYKKWEKWYYKTYEVCKGEHPEFSKYYAHKDEICKDGYCSRCCDRFMEDLGFPKEDACQKCRELRKQKEAGREG
jgi:hypothetical protein